MLIMKKYISMILITFCLILMITSCNDWLDVKPLSSTKTEELFKTEDGFKEALIGVYISMSSSNSYGKECTLGFAEALGQSYDSGSGMEYYETKRFNYKKSEVISKISSIWATQYNTIANINSILDNIDKKKQNINPILFNIIKGECLGLRAFLHLDLMKMFGYGNLINRGKDFLNNKTIPYALTHNKDLIKQKSYKETIALIEKDLIEAKELLKVDPNLENKQRSDDYYDIVNEDGFLDNRNDRFNYYAVESTLADLYFWVGDYDKAFDYANNVIENEAWWWIEEYRISNNDLKYRDMTFSSECLFCLKTINYSEIVNGYMLTKEGDMNQSMNRFLYISKTKYKEIYEISDGIGLTDYRYRYLFEQSGDYTIPLKFVQREGASDYYKNRIPLIKISDIYFIAIESLLKGKEINKKLALELLNKQREKRGIRDALKEDLSINEILEELSKEKRKEWMSEGKLFWDYKRLGKITIPGLSSKIKLDDKLYVIPYPDDEITFGGREQFVNNK